MTSRPADQQDRRTPIDWDATIKLAVVVSLVAALLVIALAGQVGTPWLILAIVVVGAVLSWRQAGRRLPAR